MKIMTSSGSTFAFAALWVALGSTALAQTPAAGGAPAPKADAAQGAAKPPPPAAPNFTAEQRKQIEALRSKTQEQLSPLQKKLAGKREELRTLWAAAAPSRAAILSKTAEIDKIHQQMHQIRVDEELAFRALLTPEQRAARSGAGPGMGGMGMGGMGMGGMGMGPGGHSDPGHGHGMGAAGMDRGYMGMGDMGMGNCMGAACAECSECGAGGSCMAPPTPPVQTTEKAPPKK